MSNRPSLTRHHIAPRSRSRDDSPANIVLLDARLHAALHQLFGNALPSEYFAIANANPERFARRVVCVMIRHFTSAILPTLKKLVWEDRFSRSAIRKAFRAPHHTSHLPLSS